MYTDRPKLEAALWGFSNGVGESQLCFVYNRVKLMSFQYLFFCYKFRAYTPFNKKCCLKLQFQLPMHLWMFFLITKCSHKICLQVTLTLKNVRLQAYSFNNKTFTAHRKPSELQLYNYLLFYYLSLMRKQKYFSALGRCAFHTFDKLPQSMSRWTLKNLPRNNLIVSRCSGNMERLCKLGEKVESYSNMKQMAESSVNYRLQRTCPCYT